MTITWKHLVVIALVLVGAYFVYVNWISSIDPTRTVKDLLNDYCQGDMADAEVAKRSLLAKAEQQEDCWVELVKYSTLPDPKARELCVIALAETRNRRKEVWQALIVALKDDNEEVRWQAAKAFRKILVHQAIEPLMKALDDDSQYVVTAAHLTLKSLTREVWPADRKAWEDWWIEGKNRLVIREEEPGWTD